MQAWKCYDWSVSQVPGVNMSQTCELCSRPLSAGYSGTVCSVCKQDYLDKYSSTVRPSDPQQAPAPQPAVSQIVNPSAPIQQVHIHHAAPAGAYHAPGYSTGKSRVVYVLLGLFLGLFGIHNFYAGYNTTGIIQLLLNVFLFWTFIVPFGVAIWVIIEICTVTQDSNGAAFS
jgi:hypothetical protein